LDMELYCMADLMHCRVLGITWAILFNKVIWMISLFWVFPSTTDCRRLDSLIPRKWGWDIASMNMRLYRHWLED
jgi:hypothetical protein